jgi:hypothetical protein
LALATELNEKRPCIDRIDPINATPLQGVSFQRMRSAGG